MKPTPMMQQWNLLKEEAKDALLLFRLGDFYEAFYEDAEIVAKEIDLTLTQRQNIPMCGVPYHAAQNYIDKLVAKGYKIAIAEQMEPAGKTKGIVERKIVQILSPGALTSSALLSDKKHNYILSLVCIGKTYALCAIDVSTSTCQVMDVEKKEDFFEEVHKFTPSEIIISEKFEEHHAKELKELQLNLSTLITVKKAIYFDPRASHEKIRSHFSIHCLDGYGLKDAISIYALGASLRYIKEDLKCSLEHLQTIEKKEPSSYLAIDRATFTNLEIFSSQKSLFHLLDKTKTPMGARLLEEWLRYPLQSVDQIKQRQDAIEALLHHPQTQFSLSSTLEQIKDMQRLLARATSTNGHARDMVALCSSLQQIPKLKEILKEVENPLIKEHLDALFDLSLLTEKLSQALVEQPAIKLGEGDTFKPGHSTELDKLKKIQEEKKDWIANYQESLRKEHNIKNLKVGHTRAFGYYIEVSKGQSSKVPSSFIRKQTLVNGERFITVELQEYEEAILHADEKKKAIEEKLFHALQEEIHSHSAQIIHTSQTVAFFDLLLSFAKVALQYNYTKPLVDHSTTLSITEGRHPIIEQMQGNPFISNDSHLDETKSLYLITGPNMAGKSTYIRQVALIALLAHTGSFVPAASAHIGTIDKIFSRIGASDDLSRGQSTFMVEMAQTANILRNATSRSLVILDEIGRGTSTYDGIAIARSVAEYFITQIQAKTLFATHYSELTELAQTEKRCANYQVAVEEKEQEIIFLHKIIEGAADKSYGIHVAKLAGLPYSVIKRAQELLENMEGKPLPKKKKTPSPKQQNLLEVKLSSIDPNHMTPMDALSFVQELKQYI